MRCPNCGDETSSGRFCQHCGGALVSGGVTDLTAPEAYENMDITASEPMVLDGGIDAGTPSQLAATGSSTAAGPDSHAGQATERLEAAPPAGNATETNGSADAGTNPVVGLARGLLDKQRDRRDERKAAQQQERERQLQLEEERLQLKIAQRKALFAAAQRSCPLPVQEEIVPLPGNNKLLDDEFLVKVGKDWGWSSERLVLTTHRLIHTHGRINRDNEIVNLTDITDVKFHKSPLRRGEVEIETSGGTSLTGLPHAVHSRELRDQLLAMSHWARTWTQQSMQIAVAASTPTPPASSPAVAPAADKYDQLRKLADLKAAGVLNDREFEQEKSRILGSQG